MARQRKRVGYSLRQTGSGRWQLRVFDPATGQHVAMGTYADKRLAEQAGQDEAGRVRAGSWVDPRRADIELAVYLTGWLRRRRDAAKHGDRYAEDAARMARLHIIPTIGRVVLTDLSPALVSRWYDELVAKRVAESHAAVKRAEVAVVEAERDKAKPATVRVLRGRVDAAKRRAGQPGVIPAKCYRLLHAALEDAVRDQLLPRNPCMMRSAGVERSPERPLLEVAQVLDLAEALPPRWRALVVVAGFCGLRFGEAAALRRGDVDPMRRQVAIERTLLEMSDGRLVWKDQPKSAAGRRTVAVPATVMAELEVHMENWTGPGAEALVFTGARGGALRRSTFGDRFAAAVLSCGLAGVTFHDLRHAAGTLAAQMGATERELQARLGHASPNAARRYQHAAARRDVELAERLGSALDEARAKRPAGEVVDGTAMARGWHKGPAGG